MSLQKTSLRGGWSLAPRLAQARPAPQPRHLRKRAVQPANRAPVGQALLRQRPRTYRCRSVAALSPVSPSPSTCESPGRATPTCWEGAQ